MTRTFSHTQVRSDEMAHELQEDTHRLDKWAGKWQLTFKADKYKVMHAHQRVTPSGVVLTWKQKK